MSNALERLNGYSAKRGLNEHSEVFDVKTPDGAFFERVHSLGYKMYERQADGSIKYTDLYNAIKTEGNQSVNAIAGSGKTTALTLKIIYDIVTGEAVRLQSIPNGNSVRVVDNMWVCTFLRTGAMELEQSITEWQRRLGYTQTSQQINFSTLDAEFKRCLDAMGVKTNIGDSNKLHTLLCKAIDSCNVTRSGGYSLTKEDYQIISGIVTYYRGRLDNSKYSHPSCQDYDITPMILDLIVKQFATLRQTEGIMDFDEISELLYKYLYVTPNPAVQDFVANRYNYIYIDEFQDTSQLQYAILKFYARGKLWLNRDGQEHTDTVLYNGIETKGKIVTVGDISQCVTKDTMITVYSDETQSTISKNIDEAKIGDRVLVAEGAGCYCYENLNNIHKCRYTGKVVKVTTVNGKTLTMTPRHKVFTCVEPKEDVFYVYLMYKHGFGFRIGQTKGVRSGKVVNGFELRLRQESADKVWLLKQCHNKQDASYWEIYYSLKYGIPQYVFDTNNNPTCAISTDRIVELHKALDTETKGMALLDELDMDFDLPIFTCSGSSTKSSLTLKMFSESRKATGYPSLLFTQFSENCVEEDSVNEVMEQTVKHNSSSGKPYNMYRTQKLNVSSLESLIDAIQHNVSYNDGYINVIRKAKLTAYTDDRRINFTLTTASQLYSGMLLCIMDNGYLVEDEIEGIEILDYDDYVYDLDLPIHRNYLANDIVVHNCIYSFKGSDSSIIARVFEEDFEPAKSVLSVNWRCPENILNPVIPSIHKNKDSANQLIQAHKKGGDFYLYTFSTYNSMLSQLLIDIKKDMEDDMSVAVLVRTNFDGVIPSLALESAKAFNFSISGENMTLASPLPRKLLGITSLFTERSTPSVKTSLQFFTKKGGEYEIAQLMNVCKTNGLNIWQIPESDLKYSAPHISSFILEIKNIFYQNGKRDKSREIEALRYIYFYMMTKVFVGDNAYCANARAYLESLIYVIDSNNFSTIYEFIEEFDFLNDKMKGRVKKSKTPIHIVTVHEAKGKEWDSVYVWNDSKDVFPSAKCDINDTQQLEEERRVHYIACTRAKKREHIYSLAGQQGMFCQELAATPQSPMNSIVTPLKHS